MRTSPGCRHHHQLVAVQMRCDEKGFLAVCAFGLPNKAPEQGPARGLQAALAIVEHYANVAKGVRLMI